MNTHHGVTHWRSFENFMEKGEKLTDEHKLDFDFLFEHNMHVGTPEYVTEKI